MATDSNCHGRRRRQEVERVAAPVRTVHAVPDPHVEHWLLPDSRAFKRVIGQGCKAPDRKCGRSRYKKMLMDAFGKSGVEAGVGGAQFAREIVLQMDLDLAMAADKSFGRFIGDLRAAYRLIEREQRE